MDKENNMNAINEHLDLYGSTEYTKQEESYLANSKSTAESENRKRLLDYKKYRTKPSSSASRAPSGSSSSASDNPYSSSFLSEGVSINDDEDYDDRILSDNSYESLSKYNSTQNRSYEEISHLGEDQRGQEEPLFFEESKKERTYKRIANKLNPFSSPSRDEEPTTPLSEEPPQSRFSRLTSRLAAPFSSSTQPPSSSHQTSTNDDSYVSYPSSYPSDVSTSPPKSDWEF